MNSARILRVATLALTASVMASTLAPAATALHGRAASRGGGFASRVGSKGDAGLGFQRAEAGRFFSHFGRYGDERRRRFHAAGYPYWGDGFYGGYGGYGPDDYGPAGFGPEGPPGMGYPPFARPMAPTLAPLAYGPGAHDGGYAYGYNGYAQTPALTVGYGAPGWYAMAGARPCGC